MSHLSPTATDIIGVDELADGNATSARTVRLACWSLALVFGAIQMWASRFIIGEDGLSYLEIADAYRRGDWHNALSAYWSPFYSWLLAAALSIVHPTPYLESTLVHAVCFVIYVGAIAAFDFMLRSLLLVRREREHAIARLEEMRIPETAFILLAYALFMWVSLDWITVGLDNPDMCLSALLYLATGLLLRIRTRSAGTAAFALLGVVLGFACLTKSAMIPLSSVFIALAIFVNGLRHARWTRALVTVIIVAAISGPFVAAVSATKGRLTSGDTGKLAYVWFANGTKDRELHWSQEFPDDRRPIHPTRKIFERPRIYDFGFAPVAGSYPVWYDPSYWHEGETPHFDLRGQLRVIHWSGEELWRLVVDDSYVVFFAALVLLAAGLTGWRVATREAALHAELLVPAIAATAMYSMVLMSPRYIAAFVLIAWTGLFAAVRLPRSASSRRLAWAVTVGLVIMTLFRVGPSIISGVGEIRSQQHDGGAHRAFAVAEGLRELGVRPGDRVARMGYGPPAYWAKLAGVRIVAEMFSEEPEFESVPDRDYALDHGRVKPEVVEALRMTGARYLIALKVPADIASQGWHELGRNTQWFAYPLEQ